MPLNPLIPVTDYQSMLNRIFWFTTASALAATWLLRRHVPALDDALRQVDLALALSGDASLPASGGYLAPALAIGIASRVFRLHAHISDWLGIRESFDLDVIVREFADELAIDLAQVDENELRQARHHIMRRVFYPFVSGARPQVDPQLIQQALDAWSWFWIGVEGALVFTLSGFALIACSAHRIGFQTLGGAIAVAAVGLPALRAQCKRYAVAQVHAILDDPQRAAAVRAAFAEITGKTIPRRAAA